MTHTTPKRDEHTTTTFWLPILLILAVVPLITVIHGYNNGISDKAWASGEKMSYDFFLYYKSRILMILGLFAACFLGSRLLQNDKGNFTFKDAWIHLLPIGVYGFFSLASAFFSEHIEAAFFGGYEQFEGVLVVLVYIVAFLLVYGYVQTEKVVTFLLNALILGSFAVSVLGAFQAFKLDWIQSKWAYPLLTPEFAGSKGINISLSFGKGMAYSTLYNPNYVGSYVSVALPVTAALSIWSKNKIFRLLAVISSICQLIMLYASQSFTGFIGVAGIVVVFLIFLFPYAKKHPRISSGVVGICIACIILLFAVKPDIFDKFLSNDGSKSNYSIQSIETQKNSFIIETGSGKTIIGKTDPKQSIYNVSLTDATGKALAYEKNNQNEMTITEKGYEKISITPSAIQSDKGNQSTEESLIINANEKSWTLVRHKGKLQYYTLHGKTDMLCKVDSFGFKNNYDFATRRGYIWSRTFPMLPSSILFGIGQDNFTYKFPNNDYVGKINSAFDAQIITKPHNMYLQIWVQDGMFACLALIALYIMLVVMTCKNCLGSEKKTFLQKIAIAILCSASGYMIVGLANDATICVAPLFWILTALGFSINGLIKREAEGN